MNGNVDDWKQVVIVTVAVVVVMTIASIGFASVSDNPLVPDATLEVRDDPDEYDLREKGVVGALVIVHTGGEPIAINETEIVVGTDNSAIRFNRNNDWTPTPSNATFAVHLDGRPIDENASFGPRDELRVVKSIGTVDFSGSLERRVRLFHLPSQRTLVDQQITIE